MIMITIPGNFAKRYCMLATSKIEKMKGTMCPLKKTAKLINEKLLNLPEIVKSIEIQKCKMKSFPLNEYIN